MTASTIAPVTDLASYGRRAPFSFVPCYRWVDCENEKLRGDDGSVFAAELRTNPSGDEERAYRKKFNTWRDAPAGDATEAAERELLEELAPRVREWNAIGADADGAIIPIPPPAVAGWEALMAIGSSYRIWLMVTVLGIHLPVRDDPKDLPETEQPPPTPEPSTPTESEPEETDPE